jgi:hypothetical protein
MAKKKEQAGIRYQPWVRSGSGTFHDRISRPRPQAFIDQAVEAEVIYQARKHRCSKSWVINTMLADYLGIAQDPKFRYDSKVHLVGSAPRKLRVVRRKAG